MKVYTHAMPYRAKADFDAYTNKAASYAYLPIATYQSTCPEEFLENCRVDKIEIGLRFYRGHASALLVQCAYDESDPLPVAEKILEGALIEPLAVEDAPAIAELAFNIACSTPSTENVPLTRLFPVSEGPVSFDSAIEHLRAFIEAAIPSSPD